MCLCCYVFLFKFLYGKTVIVIFACEVIFLLTGSKPGFLLFCKNSAFLWSLQCRNCHRIAAVKCIKLGWKWLLRNRWTLFRETVAVIVRTIRNTQIHCVGRIYSNSVLTSQETHYVSTTEPNWLMLFRETVAVYCENHTEHTDTLRWQNI
jgi:hypothetical protein